LRRYAEKDGRGYPDWALRYVPMVDNLKQWKPSPKFTVELGANENGLARFRDGHIIAVDIDETRIRAARATQGVAPVVADAAALPFRSGSVPVLVSMDMIEHLPPDVRPRVGKEIDRVLADDGIAAVGVPYGQHAANAEREIADACEKYTGRRLSWLEEHAEHGLPSRTEVLTMFQTAADTRSVVTTFNTSIRVWRWVWKILICGWPGRANPLFQALLKLITPVLTLPLFHHEPAYRLMVYITPKSMRLLDADGKKP